MGYCQNCGAAQDAGAVFCGGCGERKGASGAPAIRTSQDKRWPTALLIGLAMTFLAAGMGFVAWSGTIGRSDDSLGADMDGNGVISPRELHAEVKSFFMSRPLKPGRWNVVITSDGEARNDVWVLEENEDLYKDFIQDKLFGRIIKRVHDSYDEFYDRQGGKELGGMTISRLSLRDGYLRYNVKLKNGGQVDVEGKYGEDHFEISRYVNIPENAEKSSPIRIRGILVN